MASGLNKQTYFSYLSNGPGGKIRLLVHENPARSEDCTSAPKTFIGKVAKVPVSSSESVNVIRGMAPPSKGIGEKTQLVMGSKSTVGVISGLPLPTLAGNDTIPFVMVSKAPADVKTGPSLPVKGNDTIPFVMVSKAPSNVKTGPSLPIKGKIEKVPYAMSDFAPRSRRGRPRGSKAATSGGHPYSVVSRTSFDGKPGKPLALRGSGEKILYAVPSKSPVDVKPGKPRSKKGDDVYPFVMTSQPPDVKSGMVSSMNDVWKGKSSAVSISKVSSGGSSQSVFVPVHVINSPSQNSVPQMQLTSTRVRHLYPQMQLVDTQKSPPQVQVLKPQVENSLSQTQLQGIHVQNSSPQIKLLSTQAQKPVPHTQLLTSQARMPVPKVAIASQKYIVGHSPHQIMGQHILTTSQSPLITDLSAASSVNGDVTTVVKTLVSPHVVATTSQHSGVGAKPLLPKIITGRIKPVQIITKGVVDRTPENIPVVDLKEDESRDKSKKHIKPFQCSECGFCCSSLEGLEQHEDNHLGEVNYICDQCGKEFSTKRMLEEHLKVHATEKKFECDVCHKKFDYRDNLIFHMRIHGGFKIFTAKCPICQKKFGNKSVRDGHMKNHTVEELRKYKQANSEVPPAQKNGTSFQCDVCSKHFSDKVSLENHKVVHIKFDRGPKMEVKKKVILEGIKHPCEHCKKSFNSTLSLKSHLEICEKNKSNSVACAFCKKHYGVIKQSKDDGSLGMKFICEPCCTFLAQKSQVSGFTPRLENRFICNKCDKCFESEAQLRDHLKSHNKPVRCDLCNKNFPTFSALQDHKVSLHGQKRVTSQPLRENEKHLRGRKTLATKLNSSISGDRAVAKLKRRKKRKRIERSKARNRIERLQYEEKLKQKRRVEVAENFEVPYKKAKYHFDEGNTSSAEEGLDSGDEGKVSGAGNGDDSDDDDSDPNLGVPVEEDDDDDDDDDDFLEPDKHVSFVDDDEDDDDFDDSEVDDNEDEGLDPFNKQNMKNLEVTIKQEPADNEDDKAKVMENCTVFNALPSKVKISAAASLIPDKEIKQEKPDDYEELEVQIKQEKESEEEVVIKEENVMIKEENLFIKEENCVESILFPIKEEKLDESDVLIEEEYEFTPFGNAVKEEKP